MNQSSERKPGLQTMLIGLDGADWSLLRLLVEKGTLKEFGNWMQNGAAAGLNSIIPSVTGPAWPAMATGLNPGKLGTFDFANRRNLDDFTFYPVKSSAFSGKSIWDYLNRSGLSVGVFGFPQLTPTYPLNGWMVAGFLASKTQKWTWPYHLSQELEAVAHPYRIYVPWSTPQYQNNPDRLLDDLQSMLVGQLAALNYLLDRYPVDVLFAVFNITDFLSHAFWHVWDDTHPEHDRELSARLEQRLETIWITLDQGLQGLRQRLAEGGNTLVVSDHGFGPYLGVFHLNVWLEQNGLLKRNQGQRGRLGNRLRSGLRQSLRPWLDSTFKSLRGTRAHLALRASLLREINLRESRAFSLEGSDICGKIFINRLYARQRGIDEQQFIQETRSEIRQKLQQTADSLKVNIEVFSSDELYSGEFTELAPELLLRVNDSAIGVNSQFKGEILETPLHQPKKTGAHRQQGVFLLSGPRANAGKFLPPFDILDIAPTIYHLSGLPVPKGLDGKVALEAFAELYRTIDSTSTFDNSDQLAGSGPPTRKELDNLNERLRQLGYLE